jgi:hypothetical protein
LLQDFPAPGERASIYLGAPHEETLTGIRVRRAIGTLILSWLSGRVEEGTQSEPAIERALEQDKEAPKPEDFHWWVTVIIERDIQLPDATLNEHNRYVWVASREALSAAEEFGAYAAPYLDLLATYASTVVSPSLFERVVDEGVFFVAAGREPFGWPELTASGEGNVIRPLEALDLPRLERVLRAAAAALPAAHSWLRQIKTWRLAALKERDPWKKFQWTFLALEILANKLSDRFRKEVLDQLQLRGQGDASPSPAMDALVWGKERMPLQAKFALVALALSPATAADDVVTFGRIKKARDDLSHGQVDDPEVFPQQEAASLLERYLAAAVDRLLPGPPP